MDMSDPAASVTPMSNPTRVLRSDITAPTGSFDDDAAIAMVSQFCVTHDVGHRTGYTIVAALDRALRIASVIGPDPRWHRMQRWSGNRDIDDTPGTVRLHDERDTLYNHFVATMPEAEWLPPNTIVSARRWARHCEPMRRAVQLGLGWILPIHGEVLLVPMPTTRYESADSDVVHCDTGRPAIEWSDGTGRFHLHGVEFDEALYRCVLAGELSVRMISSRCTREQRPVALRYLRFDSARQAGAAAIGGGLHRLPLPPRLARDRTAGPGRCLYFRRLGDSQSIQWVDPQSVFDDQEALLRAERDAFPLRCL
ncbi:hypothetical protein SAMN04488581_5350 [Mycolicibacterium neoaurum]|nr:hypothetical protein SAMN04488581_5350 [Mycolicibacterium neoaurum]